MATRYTIKLKLTIDCEDVRDYYKIENLVGDLINEGKVVHYVAEYDERPLSEREYFKSSKNYQESIIDNSDFSGEFVEDLRKTFKEKEGIDILNMGKLVDIVFARDPLSEDYYYVTDNGEYISVLIPI